MNTYPKPDRFTKGLVVAVIIVHLMFFILEAIFWMWPTVHNLLLGFLDNPVMLDYPTQAVVLKKLFINQGFYNLFIACSGFAGYYLLKKGHFAAGCALLLFLCFAGTGAGVVLACSTKAYALAVLQAGPASLAFFKIYPLFKTAISTEK